MTTPARYRHPDMVPFADDELASWEDYSFQGYIPVDHSIFEQTNSFQGNLEVEEDIPNVSTIPRFYIDGLEDEQEDEPDHEYHKPPFDDGPKFIEDIPTPPVQAPAPVRAPPMRSIPRPPVVIEEVRPVSTGRPSINHIFHEPLIVEEIIEPVRVEPVKIVETVAPKKKTPPIVFHDKKPRITEKVEVVEVVKPAEVIRVEPARVVEPVRVVEPARFV